MTERIDDIAENWERGALGLDEASVAKAPPIFAPGQRVECDHAHYSFEQHGRRCTCGAWLVDFGD